MSPNVLAYSSQITEFLAAILILLGIRAFTLGIALIFAHSGKIYSEAELAFNYLLMSFVLSLTGLGKISLKRFFQRNQLNT